MKTLYLIKSLLPFVFLPIAPGVVQVELERHGILSHGPTAGVFTILIQIILTLGIILWVARRATRMSRAKEFLRMSCVSKKVFHQGQWMTVEKYLADYHNIVVSHGMTPEESTAWMRESQLWLREGTSTSPNSAVAIAAAENRDVALAK